MKIILLSDLHLVESNPVGRLDDVTETQWKKLQYVFDYAKKSKIEFILQAGDTTDVRRSWELIVRLLQFLRGYKNIRLCLVRGQHDSYYHSMTNDKTISGALVHSGLVNLLSEKPIEIGDGVFVYGASYGEDVPVVTTEGLNILVIHKQILMDKIWATQDDFVFAEDFLKTHDDFDLILCGDAHQSFIHHAWGRHICNTGVMLRLEASKQMMEHQPVFYVYDTGRGDLFPVLIPNLPSSVVLTRDHLEKKIEKKENFELFIDRVKNTDGVERTIGFEDNLKTILFRNKSSDGVRSVVSEYLAKVED